MKNSIMLVVIGVFLEIPSGAFAQEPLLRNHKVESEPMTDSAAVGLGIKSLSRAELERLPFRGAPPDYYGLFSGTVVQDYRGIDFVHVRGSRQDEIGYAFEGADVRSFFTGINLIRFIPEALESISLEAEPNASASNAAALFQHRLRQTDQNFRFALRGETDRFTSDYQPRFDTYSYGYFNVLGTAEGKIFTDKVRFFAAGEGESFDDHYRKFWDGFRFGNPGAPLRDPQSGKALQELIGVDELVIQPGNIPHANAERYTVNSAITGDFSPVSWRAVGVFNWEKEQRNDTPIRYLFDPQRIPEFKQNAGLLSLQADYAPGKNWRAHLQIDLLRSGSEAYDPVFKDDIASYRDSYENRNYEQEQFSFFAFPFYRPGVRLTLYSKSEENGWGVSGSLRKSLGNHHLQAGFAGQRRTLRYFNITPEVEFYYPRFAEAVDAFGYNYSGEKVESDSYGSDGARQPSSYSFHLEDQFRARNLQIDLGLRYEVLVSDALTLVDPSNPVSNPFQSIPLEAMKTTPAEHAFLPRFSASFFANEHLSLRASFGKYMQLPALREVYINRGELARYLTAGAYSTNPRAMTADPIHTQQMVFGLTYDAKPNLRFRAEVFHKMIEGQLQVDFRNAAPGATINDYLFLANNGESTAQGVELALSYQKRGMHAWASYTFSNVHGFSSYSTSNLVDFFDSFPDAERLPLQSEPLDFNQQHRGNVLLSYQFDREAPILLRQTGFYFAFRFNSGHNFPLYQADDVFG